MRLGARYLIVAAGSTVLLLGCVRSVAAHTQQSVHHTQQYTQYHYAVQHSAAALSRDTWLVPQHESADAKQAAYIRVAETMVKAPVEVAVAPSPQWQVTAAAGLANRGLVIQTAAI